jgi:hypothetical protein
MAHLKFGLNKISPEICVCASAALISLRRTSPNTVFHAPWQILQVICFAQKRKHPQPLLTDLLILLQSENCKAFLMTWEGMSLALFQMHDKGFQSELAIRTQTHFWLRGCCGELDLWAYTFHACVSVQIATLESYNFPSELQGRDLAKHAKNSFTRLQEQFQSQQILSSLCELYGSALHSSKNSIQKLLLGG